MIVVFCVSGPDILCSVTTLYIHSTDSQATTSHSLFFQQRLSQYLGSENTIPCPFNHFLMAFYVSHLKRGLAVLCRPLWTTALVTAQAKHLLVVIWLCHSLWASALVTRVKRQIRQWTMAARMRKRWKAESHEESIAAWQFVDWTLDKPVVEKRKRNAASKNSQSDPARGHSALVH